MGLIIWEIAPDTYMGSETQGTPSNELTEAGKISLLENEEMKSQILTITRASNGFLWHYLP